MAVCGGPRSESTQEAQLPGWGEAEARGVVGHLSICDVRLLRRLVGAGIGEVVEVGLRVQHW